jgi:hypothetical protein
VITSQVPDLGAEEARTDGTIAFITDINTLKAEAAD